MDDSLKDSWQPQGPVSKQIKERIQKAGKRFHANDNLSLIHISEPTRP